MRSKRKRYSKKKKKKLKKEKHKLKNELFPSNFVRVI